MVAGWWDGFRVHAAEMIGWWGILIIAVLLVGAVIFEGLHRRRERDTVEGHRILGP